METRLLELFLLTVTVYDQIANFGSVGSGVYVRQVKRQPFNCICAAMRIDQHNPVTFTYTYSLNRPSAIWADSEHVIAIGRLR